MCHCLGFKKREGLNRFRNSKGGCMVWVCHWCLHWSYALVKEISAAQGKVCETARGSCRQRGSFLQAYLFDWFEVWTWYILYKYTHTRMYIYIYMYMYIIYLYAWMCICIQHHNTFGFTCLLCIVAWPVQWCCGTCLVTSHEASPSPKRRRLDASRRGQSSSSLWIQGHHR